MAMSVKRKMLCGGIGFLMMTSNFSFFLGFWDLYTRISQESACENTAWWLGYDAIVCALETYFACGLIIGALWDDSKILWWLFFILHLIDAVPGYTVATIYLGKNVYSADGQVCYDLDPTVGSAVHAAWWCQAVFYVYYVGFMVSLLYQVVIKEEETGEAVLSQTDNDRALIFVNGIMMMASNFMHAVGFWYCFVTMSTKAACASVSWWLGFDAVVCIIEVSFAGGMMLGGMIDGTKWFWFFWILHLIDAVPGYTLAVVKLGLSLNSEDGQECLETYPGDGHRTYQVWQVQVFTYALYVCNMLFQTYMSVIKKQQDQKGTWMLLAES